MYHTPEHESCIPHHHSYIDSIQQLGTQSELLHVVCHWAGISRQSAHLPTHTVDIDCLHEVEVEFNSRPTMECWSDLSTTASHSSTVQGIPPKEGWFVDIHHVSPKNTWSSALAEQGLLDLSIEWWRVSHKSDSDWVTLHHIEHYNEIMLESHVQATRLKLVKENTAWKNQLSQHLLEWYSMHSQWYSSECGEYSQVDGNGTFLGYSAKVWC